MARPTKATCSPATIRSPGGAADLRNNVESVFLPAGTSGDFTVAIMASNINSDGIPNVGGPLDQDFALVVYNGDEIPRPAVVGTGATLVSEACGIGNGVLDPGEEVTIAFALRNIGVANTGDVVATLEPSGGVTLAELSPELRAAAGRGARCDPLVQFRRRRYLRRRSSRDPLAPGWRRRHRHGSLFVRPRPSGRLRTFDDAREQRSRARSGRRTRDSLSVEHRGFGHDRTTEPGARRDFTG